MTEKKATPTVKIRFEHEAYADSTNAVMKRRIRECGIGEATVLTVDAQSQGRGRRGRAWQNTTGALLMSIAVSTASVHGEELPLISMAAATGVCCALEGMGGIRPRIKWPNDILLNGCKLCGILSELASNPQGELFAIIGIGINVNATDMPKELDNNVTSLMLEMGKSYELTSLAETVAFAVLNEYHKLSRGGADEILNRFRARCCTIGSTVTVSPSSGNSFSGYAEGIDSIGRLIVVKANGERCAVDAADVSIRSV